jgi:Ca2+-binding EF-hand superfamily protein
MPRRRHTIQEGERPEGLLCTSTSANAIEDRNEEIAKQAAKSKDRTECVAIQLALRHKLMVSEVKTILKEFLKAKRAESGALTRAEFDQVLCRIFEQSSIEPAMGKNAYDACSAGQCVDIEEFLSWYKRNMFTQVTGLNADPAKAASEKTVYELARKHDVSPVDVDKIKSKFDLFDLDKSGMIDYNEFMEMFAVILKKKSVNDLNHERIKRFWSQITKVEKKCGSDAIDFPEYVDWYMKYYTMEKVDDGLC